jgi:hypothetical protein
VSLSTYRKGKLWTATARLPLRGGERTIWLLGKSDSTYGIFAAIAASIKLGLRCDSALVDPSFTPVYPITLPNSPLRTCLQK